MLLSLYTIALFYTSYKFFSHCYEVSKEEREERRSSLMMP